MATVIDDFSPISAGDTGAEFAPQFLHKDGTPVDLSDATITMLLVNASDPSLIKVCDDEHWTIDDALEGMAHYDYQDEDVDTIGVWNVYIVIIRSGKRAHCDMKVLEILYAPVSPP